jgi:hypothetical protein
MSKIKYQSKGGPQGKKRPVFSRPDNPSTGDTYEENGRTLVFNGRDWTWFPSTALDLIKFARLHRWGFTLTIEPKYEYAGRNAEGDKMHRTSVKIILLVGREPGETKPPANVSKGFTYRLVWDTSRTGLFELVSAYRRTSTHPQWTEPGSISEIRPIISRFPVLPEKTGNEDA